MAEQVHKGDLRRSQKGVLHLEASVSEVSRRCETKVGRCELHPGLKAPDFQSLIVKKDNSALTLNPPLCLVSLRLPHTPRLWSCLYVHRVRQMCERPHAEPVENWPRDIINEEKKHNNKEDHRVIRMHFGDSDAAQGGRPSGGSWRRRRERQAEVQAELSAAREAEVQAEVQAEVYSAAREAEVQAEVYSAARAFV